MNNLLNGKSAAMMLALSLVNVTAAFAQDDNSSAKEEGNRNVMLNASDANAPRYIQIGLPSEDVNVYENGLPVVYSSYIHPLSAHWRSDGSLAEVGLMNPQESGPEEAKRFNGYVMSGRYLRPFTVEFGASIKL